MDKKILYITDQQEYSQNGTNAILFDKYLKQYIDVDIVFITKFKHSFQHKENHYIVPISKKLNIIEYLEAKDINLYQYSIVIVRNKLFVLQNVLDNKDTFNYKVVFRMSYPKTQHQLEVAKKNSSIFGFLKTFSLNNKIRLRDKLANECDLILPASKEVKDEFFSNIKTKSFPIFTGLDPEVLTRHLICADSNIKFIYVGTIDQMREFDIVLDALEQLHSPNWSLSIATTHKEYITNLLKLYPSIRTQINLTSAHSLKELRDEVNKYDVGIASLPFIPLYNTVIADKVMDYYTCSLPAILTDTQKNKQVLSEDEAIYCNFDTSSLLTTFQKILSMDKEKISEIGNKGQDKLLHLKRNYKILAKEFFNELDKL
jgi:hypothetical protein